MKADGGGRGRAVGRGRASAVQHFRIKNEESILSASGECASAGGAGEGNEKVARGG